MLFFFSLVGPAGASQLRRACVGGLMAWASVVPVALAHDFKAGDLRVDHPYALPTAPGATRAVVHVRAITNTGARQDRLLGASTPVAESVLLEKVAPPGVDVPVRTLDAIELPAKAQVSLRHDQSLRLTLSGLRQPLREGDRFALVLQFARAGTREVQVWVQTPRPASDRAPAPSHAH